MNKYGIEYTGEFDATKEAATAAVVVLEDLIWSMCRDVYEGEGRLWDKREMEVWLHWIAERDRITEENGLTYQCFEELLADL